MKPSKHTIQFLLPTASPGEIELVYRELLGVIGEPEEIVVKRHRYEIPPGVKYMETPKSYGIESNELRDFQLRKLNKLFGKEG